MSLQRSRLFDCNSDQIISKLRAKPDVRQCHSLRKSNMDSLHFLQKNNMLNSFEKGKDLRLFTINLRWWKWFPTKLGCLVFKKIHFYNIFHYNWASILKVKQTKCLFSSNFRYALITWIIQFLRYQGKEKGRGLI